MLQINLPHTREIFFEGVYKNYDNQSDGSVSEDEKCNREEVPCIL